MPGALALLALLAAAPALHVGGAPVGARIELVATPAAPSPPLAWHAEGGARVGVAEDGRVRATVRITPVGDGAFDVAFVVEWRVAAEVEREAVRLVLPGPGRAVGRDLELSAVRAPLRVDRGTPILAATAALALVGGEGFVAARYTPAAGALEVDLYLDDAGAHPFAVYGACLPTLPGLAQGGVVPFAALEHKRFLGRTSRRAGERVEAHARLVALAPATAALPLVPERWPAGARGAVVFTDHADRTDPAALRAVLYGSSAPPVGAASPRPAGGFLGHGVKLTKSFFVQARRGGLAGDPEARALATALREAGSEVASHSISGGPDDRAAVAAGLSTLQAFGVVTWIDHEPYTNCEAFSNEGWRDGGRYGIRDLVAGAGLRWVWEAGDVGGFRRAEVVDLFSASPPAAPSPVIYPLPADPRLWVFGSTMFYAPPQELAAALSDEALERLEGRRGLFVAHTYLSASKRTTTRPEHVARLAVRDGPGGVLVLDPELDRALGRIAARARAGRLASLTWAEAGDRLRALGAVAVTYLPDGAARVENRGPAAIAALTLAVPAEVQLTVEGATVAGRAAERGRTRVWLELAPGASAVVRAAREGAAVPFLAARRDATLAP